jgi:hypothetical protein
MRMCMFAIILLNVYYYYDIACLLLFSCFIMIMIMIMIIIIITITITGGGNVKRVADNAHVQVCYYIIEYLLL